MKRAVGALFLIGWLASCTAFEPEPPADDAVLDGPVPDLTTDESLLHVRGDVAFNDEVFTSLNGLGPIFVATSCGSCHAGDGKGHPFTTLTRFGQSDSLGNQYLHLGGPQLQNRAIPGFEPEQIPAGAPSAKFTPPINTGLGYLELVTDADILAMCDPTDADGDGISGVANYNLLPGYLTPMASAIPKNGKYICRFGKKANAYSLLHQTINAYNQDIGVTSEYAAVDPYSGLSTDPEVTTETVNAVVFYLQTLKAPIQRHQDDPVVQAGKQVFLSIGCGSCHRPVLKTGVSPTASLSEKEFYPYTDLLLHDMGDGLNDGYTEGIATTAEWRTPPLWGLGLAPNSQGGQYYLLHDGRAHSIEEAIQLHGGEASQSAENFNGLTAVDREAILRFLESL